MAYQPTCLYGVVVFALLILCAPAQAQDDPLPDPPLPSALETVDADTRFVVDVVNRSESLFGSDLFLTQMLPSTQEGHAARIVQIGTDNTVTLDQVGTRHVASLSVEGTENLLQAVQDGYENRLGIALHGNNNMLPVEQYGDNLELSIEAYNVNGLQVPVPVEQTGTGIGAPIYIRIRPGSSH